MSSTPCIVLGEAQESDTEEEIDSSAVSKTQSVPCIGKTVFGEAPESDEETCTAPGSLDSLSSAVSALSVPYIEEKKKPSKKYQSILIKKLCEKNAALHKDLKEFISQTAASAGNELNATNRRLLKCQLQMQEGADFLKTLNTNLTTLDSQLQVLLSTKYLPVIRINENADRLQSKPP